MDAGTWGCSEEMFAALSASVDLLRDLPVQVSRLGSGDLDVAMALLDRLVAMAAAGRFTVASEADQRGDVERSASGTVRQWVTDRCHTLEARDAGILAKAVTQLNTPSLEPLGPPSRTVGCPCPPAWWRPASRPAQALLAPGAEDAVLEGLVAIGTTHGCAGVRSLRPAMLARYGLGMAIQDEQDRRAGLTCLSSGHDIGGGITEYRMRLTPESRAVVESAINTLAAPRAVAGADDGAATRDTRTVEQRRGDALVDVCRRMVALGSAEAEVAPLGVKATVLVTIGYDDLVARTRPGTLLGGTTSGTVLGPETVRRLACDADLLPVLLGGRGRVLDLGHTTRAFTPAQVKALWLRDRHCTYPGCDIPATWCDAHHVAALG